MLTYKDVFAETKCLPPKRYIEHGIELKEGVAPIQQRPYRVSHALKNEVENIIRDLLDQGLIHTSSSPFSSPVLLVKKKYSTWRMCVDYRKLNEITVKDKFPIPVIEDLLAELNGAEVFYKTDLRQGYFQIRLKETAKAKTAFVTHHGHYEFNVMPFGLTNAPATFQKLMNEILVVLLRKSVLVFFDDILVYSKNLEEHCQHLSQVLEVLRHHKLYAKRSKCSFAIGQVEYLGYVISATGVSTDPEKIKTMVDWPLPKTLKALRAFLGFTGYYVFT